MSRATADSYSTASKPKRAPMPNSDSDDVDLDRDSDSDFPSDSSDTESSADALPTRNDKHSRNNDKHSRKRKRKRNPPSPPKPKPTTVRVNLNLWTRLTNTVTARDCKQDDIDIARTQIDDAIAAGLLPFKTATFSKRQAASADVWVSMRTRYRSVVDNLRPPHCAVCNKSETSKDWNCVMCSVRLCEPCAFKLKRAKRCSIRCTKCNTVLCPGCWEANVDERVPCARCDQQTQCTEYYDYCEFKDYQQNGAQRKKSTKPRLCIVCRTAMHGQRAIFNACTDLATAARKL